MVRPLTIHIARPLPTEPGGADPAPECAGTDRKTLPAQVRGEQRHRPGVGPIPKPAWIAREQLTKLVIREGGRRARPTRPGMVGKPRWHSPSKIAPNPAMDGAAVDMRTLCDRGNGFAFGDLRDSPNTPIEPRVVRPGERPQQAPPVDPAEGRAGRAGSVHSITVGPAHPCCKTSGYLLRLRLARRAGRHRGRSPGLHRTGR